MFIYKYIFETAILFHDSVDQGTFNIVFVLNFQSSLGLIQTIPMRSVAVESSLSSFIKRKKHRLTSLLLLCVDFTSKDFKSRML